MPSAESSTEDELPPSPSPDRVGNSLWCTCGKCVPMPTAEECLCCREVNEAVQKQRSGCITRNEYFEILCLDTEVLQVSYCYVRESDDYAVIRNSEVNKKFRYVAYRQLTRWLWGPLGKHCRKVLPACAVHAIRDNFPSELYKGFRLPDV
ncbi:P2X purinoceptor 7-like [Ornithodoros turicata]